MSRGYGGRREQAERRVPGRKEQGKNKSNGYEPDLENNRQHRPAYKDPICFRMLCKMITILIGQIASTTVWGIEVYDCQAERTTYEVLDLTETDDCPQRLRQYLSLIHI